MTYALAALAIILAAAGAVYVARSVDLLIRRQCRRVVVVELRGGETFRGLLVAADARTVLLRNVEALTGAQASATPVDGELLIPRGDVKYMQRP
jgi:small nuclear ribonucleoprotein (snRNP)-like protein